MIEFAIFTFSTWNNYGLLSNGGPLVQIDHDAEVWPGWPGMIAKLSGDGWSVVHVQHDAEATQTTVTRPEYTIWLQRKLTEQIGGGE